MDKDKKISSNSRRVKKDKYVVLCDITTKTGYYCLVLSIFNEDLKETGPAPSRFADAIHRLLDHSGKMGVLKGLDLSGERFRRILRINGHFCVKNNLAVVVELVHMMDGDPTFGFAGRDHRFVDMMAVHPFSTIFGEQGRMDIDDPMSISLDEFDGDLPQKTRQHDEVNAPGLKLRDIGGTAEELLLFDQQGGDAGCSGDVQYAGMGVIANDQLDGYRRVPLEVSDDPGGVGTRSGGKDREFIHRAQNYGRPNEPGLNFSIPGR
jgi:hypothetical protein